MDTGMSVLLITHDLGIVAEVSDHVAVMYAGQVVETAATPELFKGPKHPYTPGAVCQHSVSIAPRPGLDDDVGRYRPARDAMAARLVSLLLRAAPVSIGGLHHDGMPKYTPAGVDRPVRCHLYDPDVPGRPAVSSSQAGRGGGSLMDAPLVSSQQPEEIFPCSQGLVFAEDVQPRRG